MTLNQKLSANAQTLFTHTFGQGFPPSLLLLLLPPLTYYLPTTPHTTNTAFNAKANLAENQPPTTSLHFTSLHRNPKNKPNSKNTEPREDRERERERERRARLASSLAGTVADKSRRRKTFTGPARTHTP